MCIYGWGVNACSDRIGMGGVQGAAMQGAAWLPHLCCLGAQSSAAQTRTACLLKPPLRALHSDVAVLHHAPPPAL